MTPVCKFIADRIERYHDGELKLHEAVPICTCRRIGCTKFVVPSRTGRKKFCSEQCLKLANPGRSREANKEYIWLYRMEKQADAVLRSKLKVPKMRERLSRIEANWPELAERIKQLQARAA
jgi:hypothetical protein